MTYMVSTKNYFQLVQCLIWFKNYKQICFKPKTIQNHSPCSRDFKCNGVSKNQSPIVLDMPCCRNPSYSHWNSIGFGYIFNTFKRILPQGISLSFILVIPANDNSFDAFPNNRCVSGSSSYGRWENTHQIFRKNFIRNNQ